MNLEKMKVHPYIVDSDLNGRNVENKEDAIRIVNRSMEEGNRRWIGDSFAAKRKLRNLETERDDIHSEKKRLSSVASASVTKTMEEEEVVEQSRYHRCRRSTNRI